MVNGKNDVNDCFHGFKDHGNLVHEYLILNLQTRSLIIVLFDATTDQFVKFLLRQNILLLRRNSHGARLFRFF